MPIEIRGLEYFLLSEVADETRVTRQTLWRWRQDGKIPPGHRYRGRHLIYTPAEVRAIEQYANRIEPVEARDVRQHDLFEEG